MKGYLELKDSNSVCINDLILVHNKIPRK
jgi:hypothetical protein